MESTGKHASFQVKQERPYNGEPPLPELPGSFLTPLELFFVRSHASLPRIDPSSYRLSVRGDVERELSLSLEDLRRDFPSQTVTATLQCAGNRRSELLSLEPIPGEIPWGAGAIGTARWTGVSLAQVLDAAGRTGTSARHVALEGADRVEKDGRVSGFGGSIPLEKALRPEVLLAYEMNGEPLAPLHGAPLRLVVPGYIGARSIKWLAEVRLQEEPSDNYFYTRAYQLFPPYIKPAEADWKQGIRLGETGINSAICSPVAGQSLPAGKVRIQGYACSGGERRVEWVEISLDGGGTWRKVSFTGPHEPWAWRLWELAVDLAPGEYTAVCRAWDSAGTAQPESLRQVWNFKGYLNNAWHRVDFQIKEQV